MSMIYDRENGSLYEEKQYAGKMLSFLYGNPFGRLILKIAVSPALSNLVSKYYSSSLSKRKIKRFVSKHNVCLDEYEKKEYSCFNDFFTRKKIVSHICEKNELISPADSKLSVYRISRDLQIKVKNSVYCIDELVGRENISQSFADGYCLVFRLSMDDCHRYCFIDDGRVAEKYLIKGKLHTVSSISDSRKVFCENTRQVNFLECDVFGSVICVEVGAMLVGRFTENGKTVFLKGEEKGYFEPGGSTIIILTDGSIKIDGDVLTQSMKGIETKVRYAQRIGEKK